MDRRITPRSGTVVDAKMSLALWLRAGRAVKGMSLEDVAKVTKIQPRILERLEAGKLDGLPAEVFVRGFIRSVAKCVGLDESEALTRYSAAQGAPTTVPTATPSAVAFVESMQDLAPTTASVLAPVVLVTPAASNQSLPILDEIDDVQIEVEPAILTSAPTVAASVVVETAPIVVETAPIVVESAPVVVESAAILVESAAVAVESAAVETTASGKKKRTRKPRGTAAPKGKRKSMATGTPSSAMPVVTASETVAESVAVTEPVAVTESVAVTATVEQTAVVEQSAAVEQSVAIDATAADELFGASTASAIDTSELVDASATTTEATTETSTSETATETMTATADAAGGTWKPSMPTVTTSSVPWRRPALGIYATTTAPVIPTLVIDDADPDSAEREQEDRVQANAPSRMSFLPPILAERAKNGASGQGGLTLAVIILLIAATLTLSYLMRRPSSSGDGVTRADGTVELVG